MPCNGITVDRAPSPSMVVSSSTFLFLFLPAVLLAVWAAPIRLRRFVLLAASLGFYAWGVQAFVLVIIASTLVDWGLARGMAVAEARGRARLKRALLLAGLAQNVGLLAWFKYAGFASEQILVEIDALAVLAP